MDQMGYDHLFTEAATGGDAVITGVATGTGWPGWHRPRWLGLSQVP
jgi:hypothetical protein